MLKNKNAHLFRQGDKEKELSFPISPLMDREKPSIGKGQCAFMNFIVSPMFDSFAKLCPQMKFTADHVSANKAYWDTRSELDPKDIAD